MALTRAQIETLVISNTGRSDKSTLISSAIDLALEEISNDHDWRAVRFESTSLTTTASTQTVDLSSLGIMQLLSVRLIQGNDSSYLLNYISEEQFDKLIPDVTDLTDGFPKHCYVKGDTLYLGPRPDAAYSIYVRYIKELVDGAENTIKGIDGALVAYVTAYVFGSIEKMELAQLWEQKYEKALIRARRADNRVRTRKRPLTSQSPSPTPWLDPFEGH